MTIAYYAGTSGRLSVVAVTPVLTTDIVSFTSAISSLNAGSPAYSTAAIAEVTKWVLNNPPMGEMPKSLTLESSGDTEGVLYPDRLRGGVGEYSFNVEGQFNGGNVSMFRNGAFSAAAFILKKNAPFGFSPCTGRFENYQVTGASADGSTVMFTTVFVGSGLLPVPGTIS